MDFDLANWYWFVGADLARTYHSTRRDYVAASDAEFDSWKSAGGLATKIDTEYNLGLVLGPLSLVDYQPIPPGINAGYVAWKEDENAMWLDHEDRIRVIENELGIQPNSNLPPPARRMRRYLAALRRARRL